MTAIPAAKQSSEAHNVDFCQVTSMGGHSDAKKSRNVNVSWRKTVYKPTRSTFGARYIASPFLLILCHAPQRVTYF